MAAGSSRRRPQATVRPLTTANVVADHAALVGRPRHWTKTLLRTQSAAGREILAYVASGGLLTAAQIDALPGRADHEEVLAQINPRTVASYARVLAQQPGPVSQDETAMALFAMLLATDRRPRVMDTDVALYAQLLAKYRRRTELESFLARPELVARVPDDVLASLRTDLANPFLAPAAATEEQFLEHFNAVVDPEGPAVVTLREAGATAFDRLGSTVVADSERGPLITVVTSTYNPDHALLGAARSIIDQTWGSWEMLVVDDASTDPAAPAILAAVERLDPRIRVIRKAVNGGTYRARNTAMRQVRGAYVTFLDSDDWAHPHRLATGVRPMIDQAGVIATRAYGTRVTEDLELTRPGYAAHFSTAASLMFRFPDVPARIGFFDTTRKAADTEYTLRIESAFGRPVLDLPGAALTLARRAAGTLSAGDFSFGWRHPSRWAYKQAYGADHRRIRRGESPFIEHDAGSPYFGTHRWARPGDPGHRGTRHFDVVMVGDWRRYGGPQVSMMEEITALRARGLRIGVMHLEAMRFRSEQDEPLCEPLQERLRAGEVELVFADDDVQIDVMVLRYPPILQFPAVVPGAVRPRRLLIMANQAPAEPDGSDQRYVPADVHRHAVELFGTEPLWVPQGPTIRRVLADLLPADVVAPWDNQGIIDPGEWYTERGPLPTEGLVVGRYSRDSAIKFPRTTDDLLTGYGFGPEVQVRIMGATKLFGRIFEDTEQPREVPANWTVLPSHSMPAPQFLAGLDVVLYLDDPDAHEAFGRVLLESAASGALVIASPKHEQTFGDALLYADPADAVALVEQCMADPQMVARQRETTRQRVRERWSHGAFADRILAELAAVRADAADEDDAPAVAVPATGEVVLRRTGGHGPIDVVTGSDQLGVLTAPLRRIADAELADAVAVVHAAGAHQVAADLLLEIQAAHRPGDTALDLAGDLPAGVLAVALHADGEWWAKAMSGWDVSADHVTCRVRRSV